MSRYRVRDLNNSFQMYAEFQLNFQRRDFIQPF